MAAFSTQSLSLSERGDPAEIVVGAHCLHHNRSGQNKDDLQQRFRCKNSCKQRHAVMLPATVYGTEARLSRRVQLFPRRT